jgi:hypothetical protein
MSTKSKENRRYPKRYNTQVPVEFLDKTKAKGVLMNLSRDGMLVTAKKLKAVNSFVRLTVKLPGTIDGIMVNGKVVRHTVVNEENAMGIQFLEMDAHNRDVWLNFISNFTRNAQTMLDEMVLHRDKSQEIESTFQGNESTFMVKFKTVNKMEAFFPQDWKNEDFFIRTTIQKNRNDRVILRLFHPDTNDELKLNVVVQKYGRHPIKIYKEGLFFKIAGYNSKIEAKIRRFIGIETYE